MTEEKLAGQPKSLFHRLDFSRNRKPGAIQSWMPIGEPQTPGDAYEGIGAPFLLDRFMAVPAFPPDDDHWLEPA